MIRFILFAAILVPSLCSATTAGVAPRAPEFLVNSYTTSDQDLPVVAMSPEGDFVVVWVSVHDGSGHGVFGQLFDGEGAPVAAEFRVNTYTTAGQSYPDVAMNDDGSFVVVWTVLASIFYPADVFGQVYDSAGTPLSVEFKVNSTTSGDQEAAAVATDGNGGFIVVWESPQDGDGTGIRGQRFAGGGIPVASEFQVNSHTTSSQIQPAVDMNPGGDFVVAWTSPFQDGSSAGVFAQRFESSGAAVGGEFQVNSYTTDGQLSPAVALGDTGEFAVIWTGFGQDAGSSGIFGQLFDNQGNPEGIEFRVNTHSISQQKLQAVAVNNDGSFLVGWTSFAQEGNPTNGIFGRLYDSAGSSVAAEFQVNTFTPNEQTYPAVAMGRYGGAVAVWESSIQDGSGKGVFARRLMVGGPALSVPLANGTVDCRNPSLSRPTFAWERGHYDRFRIFMGSSPGFEKGTRVTSGDKWITGSSWTPGENKWRSACNKTNPVSRVMYIAVEGQDLDLSRRDPLRNLLGFAVRTTVHP